MAIVFILLDSAVQGRSSILSPLCSPLIVLSRLSPSTCCAFASSLATKQASILSPLCSPLILFPRLSPRVLSLLSLFVIPEYHSGYLLPLTVINSSGEVIPLPIDACTFHSDLCYIVMLEF